MFELNCFSNFFTQMLKRINQLNFASNQTINHVPVQQASVALILRPSQQLTPYKNLFQSVQNLNSHTFNSLPYFKDQCSENISKALKVLKKMNNHEIIHTPNLSLFEFLLEKRACNNNDVHSGQLCFPGGKCDGNETDYETVVREAKEEIQYNLDDSRRFMNLGKLPLNAFCYFRKGKKVKVSTFLFFQIEPDYSQSDMKYNPGEIANAFWVPFNNLLSKQLINLQTFTVKNTPPNIYHLNVDRDLNEGFISRKHSGLLLQNNEMLWGITLSLLLNIINIMVSQAAGKQFKKQFQDQIQFIHQNLIQNAMQFQYNYSPEFEEKAKQLESFYNMYQQNLIQCLI